MSQSVNDRVERGRLSVTRSCEGNATRTSTGLKTSVKSNSLSFHYVVKLTAGCCRTASRQNQVATQTPLKTAETDVDFRQTPAPPDPSRLSLQFWLRKCSHEVSLATGPLTELTQRLR